MSYIVRPTVVSCCSPPLEGVSKKTGRVSRCPRAGREGRKERVPAPLNQGVESVVGDKLSEAADRSAYPSVSMNNFVCLGPRRLS
jgi:hypothetical protein